MVELGQARLQRLPAAAPGGVHHVLLLHILKLVPLRRMTLRTASSLLLPQLPLQNASMATPEAHLVAFRTSSLLKSRVS